MLDDKELIAAVVKKDRAAFARLYEKYQPQVMRYCGRLLNHDVETAADIADEVFVDVWLKGAGYRAQASVKSWIFSIAHNKAVSFIRKNREQLLDNEAQLYEIVASDLSQEQTLTIEQQQALLLEALEKLSVEHKEVVHLFYYNEMSVKEIEQVLGVNAATIRTRLYYAKRNLLPILQKLGMTADDFFAESG